VTEHAGGGGTPRELVAGDWSFPTSLAFDHRGAVYVAESGLPFGGAPAGGRVWRLDPPAAGGGQDRRLLADGLGVPVNGLAVHDGALYVSEGGHPGRISRLAVDGGTVEVLVDGLPGGADYQTNMVAVGPDGKLYFGQGAMTNSGVVGLDAFELGWLRRLPEGHDLPGLEVVLAGTNFETADPRAATPGSATTTGGFVSFGTPTRAGQRIPARLPCTAAVLRCDLDGGNLELVAWGLRNPFGLGFLPDGRLLAVDQGADERGSRPIGNAPDTLYEVRQGAWYGWPDFVAGDPVTHPGYRPTRGPAPTFLLTNHDELPPPERPLVRFPPHSAATKFAVMPGGQLVVALFGDEVPLTAPSGPRAGRCAVRVDPADWSVDPLELGPFARPIDVGFHPLDQHLYVLDFGRFEMRPDAELLAEPGTGALWRIPATAAIAAGKRPVAWTSTMETPRW